MVFDEVHYMQDRERGVVWEESIIFLPHQAHMARCRPCTPVAIACCLFSGPGRAQLLLWCRICWKSLQPRAHVEQCRC